MQPKETYYNGIEFRSCIEARWACRVTDRGGAIVSVPKVPYLHEALAEWQGCKISEILGLSSELFGLSELDT